MAKHDVKLEIDADIPIRNVDVVIPVRIDGNLRGRLKISTGSVDWWPANNSVKHHRMTWTQFAKIMESHGKELP